MYKQKRKAKFLIAAALLSAGFLSSASAAFDNGFAYSYPIGTGTTYSRMEGVNSAGLQKANYITYSPNSTVTPRIVFADSKLYGSQTSITNAAKYLENDTGSKVLGGINADFFVMSSGIPIGLVIDEGAFISSDAWQYAVGFNEDGTAIIGQPSTHMEVVGASGKTVVSYYNKTRTTAGAYMLDRNYDSSTHFSASGSYIVFEKQESAPLSVNGSIKLKVVSKGTGNSSFTIGENQMVLTKSDAANVSSWADFKIGEEVSFAVYAGGSAWNNVEYAVGGKLLVNNGTVTTTGIDSGSSYSPRSAVGIKADGSVVLFEIDGRDSNHSVGLTAKQLGEQLVSLGCQTALCLDGGGSSAMVLKKPGESDFSLITKPSDGYQRSCANYIFFTTDTPANGDLRHIVLTPSYRYVLPRGTTWFSVKGADAAYSPAATPTDVSFSVSNGMGTISDQTFTAGSATGVVTITGTDGSATGSMNICVTDGLHSIALKKGEDTVSAVSVKPEQTVDLDAIAYRYNAKMGSTDASFTWTVSDDLGTIDQNGVFTAGKAAGSGTITCSYLGVKKTISVSVGTGQAQKATTIATFDGAQPFFSSSATLSLISDYTTVARGESSLQADIKSTSALLETSAVSVETMNYISLWAKGNAGKISAVFTDIDGNELIAEFADSLSNSWKQMNVAIPEDAVSFTGIRYDGSAQTIYFDQIVATADHAITNTDSPIIKLNDTSLSISSGTAATITGTALMESSKYPVRTQNVIVRIDGKKANATVRMDSSSLTITTGALAAGTHTVTIDATDDAGNRSRATATIKAGSAANIFADTNSSWAKGYASLLYNMGIMKGENSGGNTYFRPNRNLTRMEFAVTMARILNLDTTYTGSLDFADDDKIPSWARGAVYAVSQAGIMKGSRLANDDLVFSPNSEISRAEVMTVIARCLPRGFSAASLTYNDASAVPSWASNEVKMCVSAGIVGGYTDNTLKPNGKITRAEIAKILAFM